MNAPLLETLLDESLFHDYVYSYPHKSTYRPLAPEVPFEQAWAEDLHGDLFLYLHVPFCEMRCGFCNLFTTVSQQRELMQRYLAALRRQAVVQSRILGPVRFAQMAIGGGTPTILPADLLAELLSVAQELGVASQQVPVSVETSPQTATVDRLDVLQQFGVDRISIGVQSFFEVETRALARRQDLRVVERGLGAIAERGFSTFNIDLMFGIPGQTEATFVASIDAALRAGANELYLYPLYVRPLTGLGIRGDRASRRSSLYRAGRDHLLERGFRQVSMRRFARGSLSTGSHRCQQDGMLGLGVGARSYTASLHYSDEYAVRSATVRSIVEGWIERSEGEHATIRYGFRLDGEERRRRYVILSLLDSDLSAGEYSRRFGTELRRDFPELGQAVKLGLIVAEESYRLTSPGLAASDTLGHWLFSAAVREAMEALDPR